MRKFSENNKIAISAVAVFIVSFSLMFTFLSDSDGKLNSAKTDVLDAGSGHGETENTETDQETDYRTALENYSDPIFVTNSEGVFKFASENFCGLIAADCNKIIDKKFVDYVNTNDHAELIAVYTKIIQNGEKMDAIGPLRMKSGQEEKLVLFSAKPKLDKDDKVVEIIFIAKDLTQQVEELNEIDSGSAEEEKPENWIETLYPKIKDMRDEENRLMVDKITYKEE